MTPNGDLRALPLMWLPITGLCLKNDIHFSRFMRRSVLAPYMFKFIADGGISLGTGSTGYPPQLYGFEKYV